MITLDFPGWECEIEIVYDADRDRLIGNVECTSKFTNVVKNFTTSVDLDDIRRQVVQAMGQEVGFLGGAWKSIKRAASRAVKKVGIDKIAKMVKRVVELPPFKAASEIALKMSPLGLTYGAVQKAAKLVDKAKEGDPSAVQKIAVIRTKAEEGDPAAAKIAQLLVAINDAAKKAGISVSGWASDYTRKCMNGEVGGVNDVYRQGFYS